MRTRGMLEFSLITCRDFGFTKPIAKGLDKPALTGNRTSLDSIARNFITTSTLLRPHTLSMLMYHKQERAAFFHLFSQTFSSLLNFPRSDQTDIQEIVPGSVTGLVNNAASSADDARPDNQWLENVWIDAHHVALSRLPFINPSSSEKSCFNYVPVPPPAVLSNCLHLNDRFFRHKSKEKSDHLEAVSALLPAVDKKKRWTWPEFPLGNEAFLDSILQSSMLCDAVGDPPKKYYHQTNTSIDSYKDLKADKKFSILTKCESVLDLTKHVPNSDTDGCEEEDKIWQWKLPPDGIIRKRIQQYRLESSKRRAIHGVIGPRVEFPSDGSHADPHNCPELMCSEISAHTGDKSKPGRCRGRLTSHRRRVANTSTITDLAMAKPYGALNQDRTMPVAVSSSRRPYTEAELSSAVRAICFGQLGTRRAASVYGIPRSTLRNKICKLNELKRRAEEKESDSVKGFSLTLAEFIQRVTQQGNGTSHTSCGQNSTTRRHTSISGCISSVFKVNCRRAGATTIASKTKAQHSCKTTLVKAPNSISNDRSFSSVLQKTGLTIRSSSRSP